MLNIHINARGVTLNDREVNANLNTKRDKRALADMIKAKLLANKENADA